MTVQQSTSAGIRRRTVAKTALWATPVVSVAATARGVAASVVPEYALQGWVRVVRNCSGGGGGTITFDSNEPGSGPDGDPYGLYVKNLPATAVLSNVSITVNISGTGMVLGNVFAMTNCATCCNQNWSLPTGSGASWTTNYTGTFSHRNQPPGANGLGSMWVDGHLCLGVNITSGCGRATVGVTRTVTVDPDGPGPQPARVVSFTRQITV